MSLDSLAGAVTGRPLLGLVLAYAVCPYATLWLAVRLWPKGHPRRDELLAEYDSVDWWMRPLWVGDVAIRCVLDGLEARARGSRATASRLLRLWRDWVALGVVATTYIGPGVAAWFAWRDFSLAILAGLGAGAVFAIGSVFANEARHR